MRPSQLILTGNVGSEPEVFTTSSFRKIVKVRLATTERYFDEESMETKVKTEWHTITFWDDIADLAEKYLTKGSRITVNGNPRQREWRDKEGQLHTSTEIHATEFKIITRQV